MISQKPAPGGNVPARAGRAKGEDLSSNCRLTIRLLPTQPSTCPKRIGHSTPSTAVAGTRRRGTLPRLLLTLSQCRRRRPWKTALRTQSKLPGTRVGMQRSPRASSRRLKAGRQGQRYAAERTLEPGTLSPKGGIGKLVQARFQMKHFGAVCKGVLGSITARSI